MILIACNTGMRPAEMKNLRWRDIMPAKDREGREIVVLFVQGKGKSRKLVAPRALETIWTVSALFPKPRNRTTESLPTPRASLKKLFTAS